LWLERDFGNGVRLAIRADDPNQTSSTMTPSYVNQNKTFVLPGIVSGIEGLIVFSGPTLIPSALPRNCAHNMVVEKDAKYKNTHVIIMEQTRNSDASIMALEWFGFR
jgi:hypothetical protein